MKEALSKPFQKGRRTKNTLLLTILAMVLRQYVDIPEEVVQALLLLAGYFFADKVQRGIEEQ